MAAARESALPRCAGAGKLEAFQTAEYSASMPSKKKRFIFGSMVIVSALVALVASSMQSNTLRSIPVHELRAADDSPQSLVGQRLRVVGYIGQEPVRQTAQPTSAGKANISHFTVVEKGATLQVDCRDALPDNFRKGGPVQMDGEYIAPGRFQADRIFTKCPSKYDAQNAGDATNAAASASGTY